MSDEVIEELWRIKDGIASEHGHDVRRLAAHLQSWGPVAQSLVRPLLRRLAAHLQSRSRTSQDQTVDRHAVHEVVDKDKTVGTAAEGLA